MRKSAHFSIMPDVDKMHPMLPHVLQTRKITEDTLYGAVVSLLIEAVKTRRHGLKNARLTFAEMQGTGPASGQGPGWVQRELISTHAG
jgi:hypothetical protein